MTNYAKGRKNEYKSMRVLEASGYLCIRAAGSHSPFDIVALSGSAIVLVQCKSNEWPSPAEMESIKNIATPPSARKLIHRWDDHSRLPKVKEM